MKKALVLYFVSLTCSLLTLIILFPLMQVTWISDRNQVLLISMDGFRHDYIEKVKASGGKTPNFDYLINQGVRIMRSQNAFPTITLPNHQTLVTGLYPENHGIVLNTFIDKNYPNEKFDMNNQDNLNDKKWFEKWPEPIWVTLEKLGKLTASHLWPLTDAPIREKLPFFQESQYTLLDNPPTYFPFKKRVEDIVNWLSDSRVHIDFAMLYFPEPDEIGHSYGPNNQHVFDVVMELDGVMGHMIQLMKEKNLWDRVNIILTADHGMSEISDSRQIPLDNYVNPSWYTYTLLTPIGALYPIKGKEQAVYNALKNKNPHLQVFWRADVPQSLNYNLDNGRIAPLILIAENKWSIVHKASNGTGIYGNHGYNNSEPDVQPFFIAQGPNIRKNLIIPFGYSVDVYPLMCYLLGINPQPNNGSLSRIKEIIEPRSNVELFGLQILDYKESLLIGIAVMILISLIMIIREIVKSKKGKYSSKSSFEYPYSKLNIIE